MTNEGAERSQVDMAARILEVADTVTETVKVKHAFDRQIQAKKGMSSEAPGW